MKPVVTLVRTLALAIGAFTLAWGAAAQPLSPAPAPAASAPLPLSPDEAAIVLSALGAAQDQGLPPRDAAALGLGLQAPDPLAQAASLARIEAEGLAYAEELRTGSVAARAIDRDWALHAEPFDAAAEFGAARAAGRLQAWFDALAPADPAYVALTSARRRYAALAWTPLPLAPPLKPAAKDPYVLLLRERLAAEGYAAPPQAEADVFDEALQAALALFQRRHELKDDGLMGKDTLAALNTPPAERLATIDANLERLRWSPRRPGASRIEVDLAGPSLWLIQGGVETLRMRLIVGDVRHHTPLFSAHANAVVFNPPWNVPSSIASAELWPKIRRNPGYMARNGFSVVDGQLRQAPGPKAALGYVKVDIDSPFGVYLHDTPSRTLFARDRRFLSHGCMRMQYPRDMAALLLGVQGWTRDDVEAAIAARATRRVPLQTDVPVILSYRTAIANDDGTVSFRPDVYGWDAKLIAALARR